MTDIERLKLLIKYYESQKHVAMYILWAMEDFKRGEDHASWLRLFMWCEEKDKREKLWKQFQDHYFDALMIKEGRQI